MSSTASKTKDAKDVGSPVGDFWFDNPTWKSGTSFLIRSFKDEPQDSQSKGWQSEQFFMAVGLADGYFYNLVREIGIDVRDADGPQKSLKLTYNREENTFKKVKRFVIIVPRTLDWSEEDPIADCIREYKRLGHFKDCKIEKSAQRKESSRVKWVTDIIAAPNSQTSNDDKIPEGIVVDIPTTITPLLMNLKETQDATHGIDVERFQSEISAFSYRIAWRVKKQQLEDYVTIVEVETLDDLMQKIKTVQNSLDD